MTHNRTNTARPTSTNREHRIPMLMLATVIALIVIAAVAIAAPTHTTTRTVYRVPTACTRAALAAAQAQAAWITIDDQHNIADQAALDHATFHEFRQLTIAIPARPRLIDLTVCR